MQLVSRGKVKDIYEYAQDKLLFVFTNRISAFDVVLPTEIPHKGEVLCKFAKYWFDVLGDIGIEHHMIDVRNKNRMILKKLLMIPIEWVVRGYLYGSLYARYVNGETNLPRGMKLAQKFSFPILDPTTKSDVHDVPVTRKDVVPSVLSDDEYNRLESLSIKIYNYILSITERAGFILADLKLEFGKTPTGEILLADSIGPDEFRLWSKEDYAPDKTQESYDKQIVRDYLTKTGFKRALEEKKSAKPPELPDWLVKETSNRYIYIYEKIARA